MATNNDKTPVIMEWAGDVRGDNLAIKVGQRVFTVDKYGTLSSHRYKRAQVRPFPSGPVMTTVEGLTDLTVGNTYSISQSEIMVGKLLESHLFGYTFLSVNPEGKVKFMDVDYDQAITHIQAGNIKILRYPKD